MCLAESLKRIRTKSGISQKQSAIAAGVSVTQYQNYEYGKSEPTASVLIDLANFFNVPIDYLTGKGIFSKWEDIMENKDVILDQLIRDVPALEQYDLYHADERDLMQIFPALIHDIMVRETPDGVQIGIELYSLWKK